MYLSLGQAAKEAGVAKSTISKALSSGKLSYREKNPDGYKIDPAELFRVYPKTTKTDADELSSNDWQPGKAGAETTPYSAKFEIPARRIKESRSRKKTAASPISNPTARRFARTATGSPRTGKKSGSGS